MEEVETTVIEFQDGIINSEKELQNELRKYQKEKLIDYIIYLILNKEKN